jgi:hypothetical protein
MQTNYFDDLIVLRWIETCDYFPPLHRLSPTFDFGESSHFEAERGFAVMRYDGTNFHLRFSTKLLDQSLDRIDGILRHEIGHIVDFSAIELPPGLPTTPERRADAIAELIWGQTIYYDADEVQSLEKGSSPRPQHLGL